MVNGEWCDSFPLVCAYYGVDSKSSDFPTNASTNKFNEFNRNNFYKVVKLGEKENPQTTRNTLFHHPP